MSCSAQTQIPTLSCCLHIPLSELIATDNKIGIAYNYRFPQVVFGQPVRGIPRWGHRVGVFQNYDCHGSNGGNESTVNLQTGQIVTTGIADPDIFAAGGASVIEDINERDHRRIVIDCGQGRGNASVDWTYSEEIVTDFFWNHLKSLLDMCSFNDVTAEAPNRSITDNTGFQFQPWGQNPSCVGVLVSATDLYAQAFYTDRAQSLVSLRVIAPLNAGLYCLKEYNSAGSTPDTFTPIDCRGFGCTIDAPTMFLPLAENSNVDQESYLRREVLHSYDQTGTIHYLACPP